MASAWRSFVAVLGDGLKGSLASFRQSSPTAGLNGSAVGFMFLTIFSLMSVVLILEDARYALWAIGFGVAAVASLFVNGLLARRDWAYAAEEQAEAERTEKARPRVEDAATGGSEDPGPTA